MEGGRGVVSGDRPEASRGRDQAAKTGVWVECSDDSGNLEATRRYVRRGWVVERRKRDKGFCVGRGLLQEREEEKLDALLLFDLYKQGVSSFLGKRKGKMTINYLEPVYEIQRKGALSENYFSVANFDDGTGVQFQFLFSSLISQIVASWENSTTISVSVRLPSGLQYTVISLSSVSSFVLNHLNTQEFMYWMRLPEGSRICFGVDSIHSAPGDFNVSFISREIGYSSSF